jgi:hypothetical protein
VPILGLSQCNSRWLFGGEHQTKKTLDKCRGKKQKSHDDKQGEKKVKAKLFSI